MQCISKNHLTFNYHKGWNGTKEPGNLTWPMLTDLSCPSLYVTHFHTVTKLTDGLQGWVESQCYTDRSVKCGLQEWPATAISRVSWRQVDVSCTCCSSITRPLRALLPLWKLWDTRQDQWARSAAAGLPRHSHDQQTTANIRTETRSNAFLHTIATSNTNTTTLGFV